MFSMKEILRSKEFEEEMPLGTHFVVTRALRKTDLDPPKGSRRGLIPTASKVNTFRDARGENAKTHRR